MRDLGILLEPLAATNISALVTGESGSGKEVVVRHLHRQSSRAAEPFILVACASLACIDGERLLFGELFRWSDENRYALRSGALDEVRRGTLFLDEIHEMPSALQSRLVQVIDDRTFRRLGDVTSLGFEARILAASDLKSSELRERLRPDLFHRLAVVEIAVPPLRERLADIEPLVEALLRDLASDPGISVRPVDAAAMSAMRAYNWPGNVRELRNALERSLVLSRGDEIRPSELPAEIRGGSPGPVPRGNSDDGDYLGESDFRDAKRKFEIAYFRRKLQQHHWNVSKTAAEVGLHRQSLQEKLRELGIQRPGK